MMDGYTQTHCSILIPEGYTALSLQLTLEKMESEKPDLNTLCINNSNIQNNHSQKGSKKGHKNSKNVNDSVAKNQQRTSTLKPINKTPALGKHWIEIFESSVNFQSVHFEKALHNLILQPEINSTVLLRADILKNLDYHYPNGSFNEKPKVKEQYANKETADFRLSLQQDLGNRSQEGEEIMERNLLDLDIREIPLDLDFVPKRQFVRRLVPRNPFKDYIINQTCLVLALNDADSIKGNNSNDNKEESIFVVYIPHIDNADDCPYYLPPVRAVGLYYDKNSKNLSLNYLPFKYTDLQAMDDFKQLDVNSRTIRIAFRLLQTAMKHSKGVMNGYEKRVQHDLVVSKVLFQNRYITLKKKYSQFLIDNWQENTDPKKHVFEDIAIAAFLIELWNQIYILQGKSFEFADLGCGNGALVYILIEEGFKGIGVDARQRKSWKIYPKEVADNLKEQVIIPSVLLRPHPSISNIAPQVTDNGRVFQIPLQNSTFKNDLHGTHNHKNKNKARKNNITNDSASGVVNNSQDNDKNNITSINRNSSVSNANNNINNNINTNKPDGRAATNVNHSILPNPVVEDNVPVFAYYNSATLLNSSYVNTAEFPENTFIIGNHSDELTLWMPLLGYDFMVIPCCSHALSGKKARYLPKKKTTAILSNPNNNNNTGKDLSVSAYSGLVQHVEEIANTVGWKTKKEMLRIPSTRNCAIIGHEKLSKEETAAANLKLMDIYEVLIAEGGAEGWVESAMSLMKKPPRSH